VSLKDEIEAHKTGHFQAALRSGLKELMREHGHIGCSRPGPEACFTDPLVAPGVSLRSVISSANSQTEGREPGGEVRVELDMEGSSCKGVLRGVTQLIPAR
jgi:hypothetical protein